MSFVEELARDLLLASITLDQIRGAQPGDEIETPPLVRDAGVLGTRGEIYIGYRVKKPRRAA